MPCMDADYDTPDQFKSFASFGSVKTVVEIELQCMILGVKKEIHLDIDIDIDIDSLLSCKLHKMCIRTCNSVCA